MQTQHNTSVFKSQDISFVAAVLASKKAQLVGSQRVSPYRFEFHLSPIEICTELYNQYINGRLFLSAKDIADNVRLLKSITKGT
jgi:hypothetical protein